MIRSVICCMAVWMSISCFAGDGKPIAQRSLVLSFQHMAGTNELVLGNSFVNSRGDTIIVQRFKYYLSNFSLTDDKGKIVPLPDTYFLIDEADPSSKTITLTVPDIAITGIGFLIGVDSIKNVSGIQTGVLDPLKGMFWTWNSGYVMAKIEGRSSSSTIAGRSFTYHIGGFRSPMNVLRTVAFPIEGNYRPKNITISADINQWFKSKSELKIAETPVCHSPGPLAVRIADNYRTMFSINSVR
jgi:hypothetical protein